MAVNYYTEECEFNYRGKLRTTRWVRAAIAEEGLKTGEISIIFCSDGYLLEMNKQHLRHDYFTDIITFGYDDGDRVSGDLFISINTVATNAEKFGAEFTEELKRVIIHGVMHLCGYPDKTEEEARTMRGKEDYYLEKFENA